MTDGLTEGSITCTVCAMKFATEEEHKKHMQEMHPGEAAGNDEEGSEEEE